jgi:hypothetical protein
MYQTPMASGGVLLADQQSADLPDHIQQKVHVFPAQTVIHTARPKHPFPVNP